VNETALSTNIEIGALAEPFEIEEREERCMELSFPPDELITATVLADKRSSSYLGW
jgi:hypothetical protein